MTPSTGSAPMSPSPRSVATCVPGPPSSSASAIPAPARASASPKPLTPGAIRRRCAVTLSPFVRKRVAAGFRSRQFDCPQAPAMPVLPRCAAPAYARRTMADHERHPEPHDFMGRVFDELEAEFESELQREAESEAAAVVAAQVGEVPLWEHLSRRIGGRLSVRAGGLRLDGVLPASYPDFVARATADGRQHLAGLGPEASIGRGPRRVPLGPPVTGEVA